ncbi:PEP-CTERM sorting domain-containing protein [Phycisphaerales bacterium AB-hyl4]|uniref:PEP-CTERM sorting domain-containing protein n=1 Tax=Natronomicrosphaera hydrolytica TaxID=3242702 RepID=A0ABV4U0A4_9BACT
MKSRATALATMVMVCSGVVSMSAEAATVQVLARTGDVVDGHTVSGAIGNRPDINNAGQVVWMANNHIFIDEAIHIAPGTNIGGRIYNNVYGGAPVINNHGVVGFSFRESSPAGTLFATDTTLQFGTGDSTVNGHSLTSVGAVSINDAGMIAWASSFRDGTQSISVITTPTQFLIQQGNTISGVPVSSIPSFSRHALNSQGEALVMFADNNIRHYATQNGVIVSQGNTIGGITLTSMDHGGSINDHGDIAFMGFFAGNTRRGIFTNDRVVAVNGDVFDGLTLHSFNGGVDINNAGQVAFLGTFVQGGSGLFLDDELLLKTGDLIDGVAITGLGIPALNDSGLITAHVSLADGSQAIVLVPEPASALLIAAGLLVGVRRRFRMPPAAR